MTKGIDLSVAADTRSATSAINRGLIDPLEDVSELLERVGRDGDDATQDIERGMRDAQRRTEDAKDEIRDIRDELNRAGRSGKTAGQDIDDGMKDAKRGVEDFGDEANSTARETAASFDGSAESIGDAFQEIAANAFAGFGPAGAAAGLAAALGLGAVFAEMERQKEQADQLKARLGGLYQEALESGRDYIDQSQFIAESNDLRFNPDRAAEWKRLQEDAKRLALDENTLIKANAGDLTAQEVILDRINRLKEEAPKPDSDSLGVQGQALLGIENRWKGIRDATQAYKDATQDAAASTDAFLREAIEQAETATMEVDELGNKLLTLPTGQQILIEAQTGRATENLDAFQGDLDDVPETVSTTAVVSLDDSAVKNYRPQKIIIPGELTVTGRRALIY